MKTMADTHAGFPSAEMPSKLERAEARGALVELLERYAGNLEGSSEISVPGVTIGRATRPGGPTYAVQGPALLVVAQGSKCLRVGAEEFAYDPQHYVVSSVDLPMAGMITKASPQEPYLSLRCEFNAEDIAELIRDENLPPIPSSDAKCGLYVHRLDDDLVGAVLRLLRLHETPKDIPMLAPIARRELLYWLLMKGQGACLRQIALQDSPAQRVISAIGWLRGHYARSLRIAVLAREVHMSVSSLHLHFKTVTGISPLQYQKQLRLQEARRLIFAGERDMAMVARQIGYESSSQFSREYSRMFGAPPLRDRRRLLELDGND